MFEARLLPFLRKAEPPVNSINTILYERIQEIQGGRFINKYLLSKPDVSSSGDTFATDIVDFLRENPTLITDLLSVHQENPDRMTLLIVPENPYSLILAWNGQTLQAIQGKILCTQLAIGKLFGSEHSASALDIRGYGIFQTEGILPESALQRFQLITDSTSPKDLSFFQRRQRKRLRKVSRNGNFSRFGYGDDIPKSGAMDYVVADVIGLLAAEETLDPNNPGKNRPGEPSKRIDISYML